MAREIKTTRFPLTLHTSHNMRVRMRCDEPQYQGCQIILNMLIQSPLGYALSAYIWLHPFLLQEFWWTAQTVYPGSNGWITSLVMGKEIILSEETIRSALQLNDDINVTVYSRSALNQTLIEMGYESPSTSRGIRKSRFIPPWQFLVTQLGVCFSSKYGHFNDLSFKLLEVVHAVVHEKPYNFSKYLMRDFERNMHCVHPS